MPAIRHATFVLALAIVPFACPAAFVDDFNTGASSGNYATVTSNAASTFATYAYDYSAMGIPSAPNTADASTKGLRLDANFTAAGAAAITLHTLASYAGDYTVKFDAWLNVNGPFPDGGSGSTNYLSAGVGGDGATNNFLASSASNPASSGLNAWTVVDGDNGNGNDYRIYKGTAAQTVATNQYAATDTTDYGGRNGLNPYYASLGNVNVSNLPVQGSANGGPAQQNGTSYPGSFGMAWHQVELDVSSTGGTGGAPSVKWIIDGLTIATLDAGANGPFSPNGSVTLGYADPTANASDLPTHSFALFDNLRITPAAPTPEPATLALLLLPALALTAKRRRRA